MTSFKKAQKIVGISEGGYQDNPRDEGNYYKGNLIGTNWGISAPTLAYYLGRIPTKLEMQNLSRETAEQILKTNYWLKNNLDKLNNQSVATLIYDGVVNQGTNAMRFLMNKVSKTLHRPIDYYNAFTIEGIKHWNRVSQKKLFYSIKDARREKYLAGNPVFISGWLKRLDRIKYYSNNSLGQLFPFAATLSVVLGIFLIAI